MPAFNLDFYTEVLDLSYLLEHLASDPFFKKFLRLNEKLAEVIQDYGLVSFVPLNVQVGFLLWLSCGLSSLSVYSAPLWLLGCLVFHSTSVSYVKSL